MDDTPLQQLIEANAPAALIQQMRERLQQQQAEETVPVWPCNWHALCVCCDLPWRHQWVSGGLGGGGALVWIGFDLGALQMIVAAHKDNPHRQPWPRLWRQIKQFEAVALDVLNDRR